MYLGTPAWAVPPLEALVDAGFDIGLVVTRADKRRRRRGAPEPSPVKAAAARLGLPVSHRLADVTGVGADLGVVVAFGRIIPPEVLEVLPMVNLHFSLLPRWRGAAPVQRAILAGDTETGVCLMAVTEGLDEGPVYGCRRVPISPTDTTATLGRRLVDEGVDLLLHHLRQGLPDPVPQTGTPTYADKVTAEDLRLDWSRPASELARRVRVGGAWTTWRGKRFKVHAARVEPGDLPPGVVDGVRVGTGDGVLVLEEVQVEGRAPQPAEAWRRGARLEPGERLV